MKSVETALRKLVREQLFLIAEEENKKANVKGSIDTVASNIAKKLGKEDLAGALTAAIKKKKGGKDAADLSTSDKNALADTFLELIFAKPDLVSQVAADLKKIFEEK